MASDSTIRIDLELDAQDLERGTQRAGKSVEDLRARVAQRMGAGGTEAGTAWGKSAAEAIARHGSAVFAATTSVARVASAALAASGREQAASWLNGAAAGATQLGAALSPLGPAAMAVGAAFGGAAGGLSAYITSAKTAREETERLAEAARKSAAGRLLGYLGERREQSRMGSAGDVAGIQARIQALQDRDSDLTRLIDAGLANRLQLRERKQIRESLPGWQSALGQAEWVNEGSGVQKRAAEIRSAASLQTADAQRRAAELANLGASPLTAEDRTRLRLAGASSASERIGILEGRGSDLAAELAEAIRRAGGDRGWGEVESARERVRANQMEIELARLDAGRRAAEGGSSSASDLRAKIDAITIGAPRAASAYGSYGGIMGGQVQTARTLADQRQARIEAIQTEQARLLSEISAKLED